MSEVKDLEGKNDQQFQCCGTCAAPSPSFSCHLVIHSRAGLLSRPAYKVRLRLNSLHLNSLDYLKKSGHDHRTSQREREKERKRERERERGRESNMHCMCTCGKHLPQPL